MLTFKYGTVGAAKTLALLVQRHQLRDQSKSVTVVLPSIDTRGNGKLVSRAGLECEADILLGPSDNISTLRWSTTVLVDEAQFLTREQVITLREWADSYNKINIFCYGLKTDFQLNLFEGSKTLLELSDVAEEIPSPCNYCNRKSIFNMRVDGNEVMVLDGPQIEVGFGHIPVCSKCYSSKRRDRLEHRSN